MVRRFDYWPEETPVGVDPWRDQVVVPNIPLFAAGASMKEANSFTVMGFKAALSMLQGQDSDALFIRRSVQEILWGYDDELSSMASMILPPEEVKAPGKFGLMAGQNLTSDGVMTVNTGQTDLRRLGEVLRYRNATHWKAWTTEECNRIQGGEGGFFPPGLNPNTVLEIFVPPLCRALKLTFDDYMEAAGMKAMRFRPDPKLFDYDAPENECYCPKGRPKQAAASNQQATSSGNKEEEGEEEEDIFGDDLFFDFGGGGTEEEESDQEETTSTDMPSPADVALAEEDSTEDEKCHGRGLFEIGPCKFGAPLAISWPHFLDSSDFPSKDRISGLAPDLAKHGMTMDVQPDMGVALGGNVRLQFNLKMEKFTAFSQFNGLPLEAGEALMAPLMWMEDEIFMDKNDKLPFMLGSALKTGAEMTVANAIMSSFSLLLQLSVLLCYLAWKKCQDQHELYLTTLPTTQESSS